MTRKGKKGKGGVEGREYLISASRGERVDVSLTACHRLARGRLWACQAYDGRMRPDRKAKRWNRGSARGDGRCVVARRGRGVADARLLHICTASPGGLGKACAWRRRDWLAAACGAKDGCRFQLLRDRRRRD